MTTSGTKRKRSNYKRTRAFKSRLLSAHLDAQRFGRSCEWLIEARASVMGDAAPVSTGYERAELWGYSQALWDMMVRQLEWRLGTSAGPIARGTKWDYATGQPTHGAHFWIGGLCFDGWQALSRTSPSAEVIGTMRDIAENDTAREAAGLPVVSR